MTLFVRYGAQLVADGIPPPGSTYPPGTVVAGGIKVGDMLIVFFSIIMGAMGLGQMFSLNPEFAACRASAHAVVSFIDRQPKIDGRADAPGDLAPRRIALYPSNQWPRHHPSH